MDYKRLHEDLTVVIAKQLHYLEHLDNIGNLRTAREVTEAIEGGVQRFQANLLFAAKVKSTVSAILQVVSANDVRE